MKNASSGFTLVEILAVMVILGALAAGFGGFAKAAVEGYAAVAERARAAQQATLFSGVLRAEMESALPGSLRSAGPGRLEFVPALARGIARLGASGEPSECPSSGEAAPEALEIGRQDECFETLGPFEAREGLRGQWLALTPENSDSAEGFYADSPGSRARVAGLAQTGARARIQFEPGALRGGEDGLFHIASGPVSYACDARRGELRRYWGYAPQSKPPGEEIGGLPGVKSAVALSGLSACAVETRSLRGAGHVAIVSVSLRAGGSSVAMRFQAIAPSRPGERGALP